MQVTKLAEQHKTHTFPCVLENKGLGLIGAPGLILFCYKNEKDVIVGVVLDPGTTKYRKGSASDKWSINAFPHHWKPVNVSLIMEISSEND